MPLTLDSRFCGSIYIIRCQGRIVAGEDASLLDSTLENRAREFKQLVLNLSDIERLDSTGMGMLVRYSASLRRRGGDLHLAAPAPFVERMLSVTGLSSVLQVYSTEEEAIVSFLEQSSPATEARQSGPKVLVLDPSPDLCAFVKAVLTQHGFHVKPTCLLHDARIMLKVDRVDYILIGPGTPRPATEALLQSLKAWAPNATTLQLDAGFQHRDADQAAQTLLQLFQPSPAS
jgi:anti-sigma B factor antagonist